MQWIGRSFVLGLTCTALLATPRAEACGGTFCDAPAQGQAPMPVDQTGENVLFVMANGMVEAHIQIQYTGDPERFAWVIPVPTTPELSVGSQNLFVNLLNATVPTFTLNTTFDACGGDSTGSRAGCGMSSSDDSGSASYSPGGGGNTKGDAPQIRSRQAVGAFEATVLEPTSAQGMVDWLELNGFDADAADAVPVLSDYINRHYQFVTIKLRPAAGTDEIHPLVIRYPGNEPCVPLKLTAIAATDDMVVRTFFLGERRVVPTNYKHVTLNQAHLDFRTLGSNYNLAVSRAVDSPVANGQGFVTEYAGPSQVTPNTGLYDPVWSNVDFTSTPAEQVVSQLTSMGLMSCSDSFNCTSSHPLLFALLDRYLPPPSGVAPADYYACVSCYTTTDPASWDPNGFATDFATMIAEPGKRAQQVLQLYPYLTRLLTRLSPAEMSVDPMFQEWPQELGDENATFSATQAQTCSGDWVTRLPDGREVPGGSLGVSPDLPSSMPWAERIEEFTPDGERIVLVDNSAAIRQQLANMRVINLSKEDTQTKSGLESGCGCSLPGRDTSHGLISCGLALMLLVRRRRRSTQR
ncbi:MAG: DUF2330 domain-containing protein [Polyangiaceae bacterium]